MLPALIARALGMAGKSVVAAAANAVANELRKPETQAKIAGGLQSAAHAMRDPQARQSTARALGRAAGTLKNALGKDAPPT